MITAQLSIDEVADQLRDNPPDLIALIEALIPEDPDEALHTAGNLVFATQEMLSPLRDGAARMIDIALYFREIANGLDPEGAAK